jgi:hypothetical protein
MYAHDGFNLVFIEFVSLVINAMHDGINHSKVIGQKFIQGVSHFESIVHSDPPSETKD